MTTESLESSLTDAAAIACGEEISLATRHPDSWAAYGRFIFSSVTTCCSHQVETVDPGLRVFQQPILGQSFSIVHAYQDCADRSDSIWSTSIGALRRILERGPADHLIVYAAGAVPHEDMTRPSLHHVMGGSFIGVAFPYETSDILELPPNFDEFLTSLGHNNRRHMRARRQRAIEAGIRFDLNGDPGIVDVEERYALGLCSRPYAYSRKRIDAYNRYAQAQPGFFHCTLRNTKGELLSYCMCFIEDDSAVMMYQLNNGNHPELGLSMTLRGFLIEQCTRMGIRRLVLPMGISGHLKHAGTTNPVVQVVFVRRSLVSAGKALLIRLLRPGSCTARMIKISGFAAHILRGR